jgi:hypothetical protein
LKVPRAELGQELASPAATFYEMLQAERGAQQHKTELKD